MRGFLSIILVFLFILSGVSVVDTVASNDDIHSLISISTPAIIQHDYSTSIKLLDVNTYTITPGAPKLPVVTKTWIFPWGTKISNIRCNPLYMEQRRLLKPIETTPPLPSINNDRFIQPVNLDKGFFPKNWFDFTTGVGLDENGKHVLFLTLKLYPIRYNIGFNSIEYSTRFDITIDYQYSNYRFPSDSYDHFDLLIITPNCFKSTLIPLQEHKNNYGVPTLIKTTEGIYQEYQGRDEAEKIKYCIKDMIETYGIKYVLLVGDICKLPIRQTDAYPWSGYHGNGILSDLYYADIYDSDYKFCSWDANNNGVFGEVDYSGFPPKPEDNIDDVDLYPDVYIGRIPCSTSSELSIIVNKIITYEDVTFDQIWFQKIILVGGDTFPLSKFAPPFVYEGEITNQKVAQQLPGFEQIRLWTSKHNLNAVTFNYAVSKGAGFLSYAGHGFEHGWGTYRPNAILDHNLIFYFTPYLNFLHNQNRLPVVFFDACLTAKLDFNLTDLKDYLKWKTPILNLFLRASPSDLLPPFAWCFLKKEDGGGIAVIGATRPAYTYVDKYGVYAGAGYLDVHFFKGYHEGVKVGEMLVSAQNDYINYVGKDYFTLEEFILIGDPSLQVGGYP